jgi:dihydrofolate reductase
MGRIIVSENISLDGVIEDPRGEERLGRGDWFTWISDQDRAHWAQVLTAEILAAEAVLMGRRTYEYFVARYPSRSGELADRLNSIPKYVVSATLKDAQWTNSTVLKGHMVKEVSTLKQTVTGEIVVYASAQLAHALIEHELVEELRLMTFPFVVGAGKRLFSDTSSLKPLSLNGARTIGDGLTLHTYRSVRNRQLDGSRSYSLA